jgi:hypothetical protein
MVKRRIEQDARRTTPSDHKPYSPSEIDRLYRKDRIASNLNVDGGDGLMDKRLHDYEVSMQQPQRLGDHNVDGRLPDYLNDVPTLGRRAWLRGHGKAGSGHLDFDHVGNPGSAKGGSRLKATGQDISESPFSAAYIKPSYRRG